MPGGSTSPEGQREQRCCHCGLFFDDRGIKAHESNCEWQDYPGLHPLAKGESPFTEEGDTPNPEPADAVGASPTPDGSDPTDMGGDPPEPADAVTDGGSVGLGLKGPPEVAPDVVDDDQEAGDDQEESGLCCTNCDDPLGVEAADLEDGAVLTCTCGHRMRWSA